MFSIVTDSLLYFSLSMCVPFQGQCWHGIVNINNVYDIRFWKLSDAIRFILHELAVTFIVNCHLYHREYLSCCVVYACSTKHWVDASIFFLRMFKFVTQNIKTAIHVAAWSLSCFEDFKPMSKYIITLKLSIMLQQFRSQFNSYWNNSIHKSIYLYKDKIQSMKWCVRAAKPIF